MNYAGDRICSNQEILGCCSGEFCRDLRLCRSFENRFMPAVKESEPSSIVVEPLYTAPRLLNPNDVIRQSFVYSNLIVGVVRSSGGNDSSLLPLKTSDEDLRDKEDNLLIVEEKV